MTCVTARSAIVQAKRVIRPQERRRGSEGGRGLRGPEGEARDHSDHVDWMVWVWALEAAKPIFLRTVGWEAVVAAAAMLQAKQERGLHNSLDI